jgi:hypothetical protein
LKNPAGSPPGERKNPYATLRQYYLPDIAVFLLALSLKPLALAAILKGSG